MKIKQYIWIFFLIIKNYWKTKKYHAFLDEENENEEDEVGSYAKIEFILNDKDDIKINIYWNDESDELAQNLGCIIYHINNGTFTDDITNLLLSICKNDTLKQPFVQKCSQAMNQQISKDYIIKPSEVFQLHSSDQ